MLTSDLHVLSSSDGLNIHNVEHCDAVGRGYPRDQQIPERLLTDRPIASTSNTIGPGLP